MVSSSVNAIIPPFAASTPIFRFFPAATGSYMTVVSIPLSFAFVAFFSSKSVF